MATWLAATAKRCGYPADLLSQVNADGTPASAEVSQSSRRLKGKARKVWIFNVLFSYSTSDNGCSARALFCPDDFERLSCRCRIVLYSLVIGIDIDLPTGARC